MAKQQPQRPQQRPQQPAQQQRKAAPSPARRQEKKENIFTAGKNEFIFDRQNFMLMGVGLGLVILGLILMSGGAMPDPAKWEPERIYSFRRITLAPFVMMAGFMVVIYGIFKKTPAASTTSYTVADNSAAE